MTRMQAARTTRRPRLFCAVSYDARATKGIVVIELRGQRSSFWQRTVETTVGLRDVSIEFALAVARHERVVDFDLMLPRFCGWSKNAPTPSEIVQELGQVRLRRVEGRKNAPARAYARDRLRELVPSPPRDEEYSLADYGVALEIAELEHAASEELDLALE